MLLSRIKIIGHSMSPTYQDKNYVIVSSIPYIISKPAIGDVVVFEKSGKNFIKRINNIEKNNYFLLGDNKNDSLDSRKLGPVERKSIKGKVIIKL